MQPTDALLDRFLAGLAPLHPVAVWAHGSLAGGDYREGRSDLDLIAVLPALTPRTVWRLATLHARLRAEPLSGQLHCTYLTPSADMDRRHLTWAHEELFKRPVTPVTRRELHAFGRVLHGKPPADLLPPVPDRELADFVVRDQRDFWRPALDNAPLWIHDVWVDLGLLTFARATVTLREGRLISKRKALELLPGLGAPVEVVADIRGRRYGDPAPAVENRAALTRTYLGPAIDELVAAYG
ncbi:MULTISPECIES: nucleotidyltransferase domain-containing protein [unclassified Streptomyces]|uniref:nucleotidyltransferase domain-containing protein n=1 Tax=unclassified Streptomyces TaxID=2593676 RepID=UPI000F50C923|nr:MULTISPECIES: nucleotidyltransferase domain-containing protein [unclassified Streptomyces]MDH6449105.1 putative nucleotidyltransferase [Streptomyces sp. SAI-119]MDH6500316.1 putative nucleotidyltransferase [Streptomyces sp. SAI-149]